MAKDKVKNKQIMIDISAHDIIEFEQLVHYGYAPFTWTFDGVDVTFVKKEEEDEGMSICPDCDTTYTDSDIEGGKVTPCPDCYKCYTKDCSDYACNCGEEAINGD